MNACRCLRARRRTTARTTCSVPGIRARLPSACHAQLRKLNESACAAILPSAKRKAANTSLTTAAVGLREHVARPPVRGAPVPVVGDVEQLDLELARLGGQHPPHRARLVAAQPLEHRVVERGARARSRRPSRRRPRARTRRRSPRPAAGSSARQDVKLAGTGPAGPREESPWAVPSSYEEARDQHEWDVPERYNIAADVCDKHPPDKLAMIHEDFRGTRARGQLGRAAGGLEPLRPRPARARRREGRPRRDAAPAHARDGGGVLRHLQVRGDPALDVGALRRRRDPPPRVGLRRPAARHRPGERGPHRPGARRARAADRGPARRTGTSAFDAEDTLAEDPAQLYYSSGTTGLAKGILHAHRYLLAHEEFVYCHDVQDGELFHGMGEWAWAAGIAPLFGPWRFGAVQLVYQREGGFDPHKQLDVLSRHGATNVFTTPTAMRSMMADHRRGHALPAAVPRRVQRRRAAQPGGDPLVPRAVRAHGARLLRAHGVLSARRQLPVHGRPRGLDGTADAGLGRRRSSTRTSGRSRRASAARSACARGRTRTTRWATGTTRRRAPRRSAASGSTRRTRPASTRTATSGTRAARTT